jgi:hypothetical protein
MEYLVNDIAVNDRIDWRHQPSPAPSTIEVNDHPGIAKRFVTVGSEKPGSMQITGYLVAEGATYTAANGALLRRIVEWDQRRNRAETSKVTIHGIVFDPCKLEDFRVLGPVEPANPSAEAAEGTVAFRRLCVWTWMQLVPLPPEEEEP